MRVQTRENSRVVIAKTKQANIRNLGHAGAVIRLTARRSIRKRKTASAEGKPPSTRRGQLRSAIAYSVVKQKDIVFIGPEVTRVGRSGAAHEHGGRYRKEHYPKRPFMGPALRKTKDRLPRMWAGSVKS